MLTVDRHPEHIIEAPFGGHISVTFLSAPKYDISRAAYSTVRIATGHGCHQRILSIGDSEGDRFVADKLIELGDDIF